MISEGFGLKEKVQENYNRKHKGFISAFQFYNPTCQSSPNTSLSSGLCMTVCNRNQPSWQLLSPSRVQLNPRQRCNEHFVLIPLLQLSRLPLPEPRERKWLSLILSLRALNSLIDFQSSFFACVALSSWVHMDHGCRAEATVPTGSINMNYLCVCVSQQVGW